ncbi:RNA-binding protein FUS [Folsomia candida]|uniref:Uncharacterized protein n=1 Tax=Folsomia candida TaxID=158441 RepID=A0A226D968_FOLCA|nr:RNA-binding protein FUS [Folsomia candida]OXA41759.1 hypothetical protein Fcan01_23440 [Folsomia candida]
MKVILLVSLAFAAVSSEGIKPLKPVKPQTRASAFTYNAGVTAAYPPQTGLIYNAGTFVKYVAGTTVYYPYNTLVNFLEDSQFYVKEGPVSVVAGTNITFGQGTQVAFPPGTGVKYVNNYSEAKYLQFNGNTHTIVQYPNQTPAQYYCSNCDLRLFQASTNPLVYYNPGGSTPFGASAMPVETDVRPVATARTYGYYGGGCGYSYCSGYSYGGYPQTTYYNYNTGYSSTCYQTGYNSYSYGGGGGGGYSMAGGSCYGGGAYYGSYGGGGGGGGGYYGK